MKTYYLTLSQKFPASHPKAGKHTFFCDKLHAAITGNADYWNKLHTIRVNYDFWAKRFKKIAAGEACLSIREWIGKPYGKGSTQHEIARLTREDGIGLQQLRFTVGANNRRVVSLYCSNGCKDKNNFAKLFAFAVKSNKTSRKKGGKPLRHLRSRLPALAFPH